MISPTAPAHTPSLGTPPSPRPAYLRALDAFRSDWHSYVIYIGFVLMFVLFAILLHSDGFLSSNNLLNIFRQTATISVMAVAMTFVIACAEIDLSIGSVAGLASVVAAMTVTRFGWLPGVAAGLAVGAVVGTINGGLITLLNIPSFLVTLGMLGIAVGFAQWITSSAPQPILDNTFNTLFGSGDIGRIPGLLIWTIVAVALGTVVMNKTSFGRRVLATGGNRVAAQFTGINTARIKFTVMLVMSIVASIGGMLYAGRLQSGRFQWGSGDELSVIAAVILGGTSLFGGTGKVIGSLFGALLHRPRSTTHSSWRASTRVNSSIVRGVIIIVAVALARRK